MRKGNSMIFGGLQKIFSVKIKKEEIQSLDRTQIMYLQVIHGLVDKSLASFGAKQHKKCLEYLKIVIRVAELANDF